MGMTRAEIEAELLQNMKVFSSPLEASAFQDGWNCAIALMLKREEVLREALIGCGSYGCGSWPHNEHTVVICNKCKEALNKVPAWGEE